MEACDFDPSCDRLFSVGDLIDRGPHSDDALAWLESWRIRSATLGNHEAMMLDALGHQDEHARRRALGVWHENGGGWWLERDRRAGELHQWRTALRAMPLAITVETAHGPVGIVHALPCPGPWGETVRRCEDPNDHDARSRLLWGLLPIGEAEPGTTAEGGPGEPRAIIAGHLPASSPKRNGRVIHIDTGAGLDVPWARVTLACISAAEITYHSSSAGARDGRP